MLPFFFAFNQAQRIACLLTVVCLVFASCSSGPVTSYRRARTTPSLVATFNESPDTPWRPQRSHTIPVVLNSQVEKWIGAFNGPLRPNFKNWIYRLGQYGPTIENVLKEEGAPPDLIYLAMIESGFSLKARSHASAVGPWQFISSTGRLYGLHYDIFVDERQDLIQSTRAASRHLMDLHKVYGDWYLAFAAYNAGPGKVNRAIHKAKTRDYWKISSPHSHHLRRETKDYVPKLLAALHIVKNYKKYGYHDRDFGLPLQYEIVTVPDATELNIIAQSARTSVDAVQNLNPALISGITPPGRNYAVYVPKGSSAIFKKNYAKIPASKRVASMNKKPLLAMSKNASFGARSQAKTVSYRVKNGDTLSHIAHKHGTSVKNLARWNQIKTTSRLRIGQRLTIYKKSYAGSGSLLALNKASTAPRLSGVAKIIAQNQTEPVSSNPSHSPEQGLPDMKSLSNPDSLVQADQPGEIKTQAEKLEQPVTTAPNAKNGFYTVKGGDTLFTIAAKHSMRVSEVKTLNNLKSNKIGIGQRLLLQRPEDTPAQTPQTLVSRVDLSKSVNLLYVVRPNDTLYHISRKYNVSVSHLKDWNHLNSNSIRPGQRLRILKNTDTTNAVHASQETDQKIIFHSVKSGETLWALSRKYGVKISDIMRWNKLKNHNVKPRQKLKIIASASGRNTASL